MPKFNVLYYLFFLIFASCQPKKPASYELAQQSTRVQQMKISPDESLLATISASKHDILLWWVKTGGLYKRIPTYKVGKPTGIAFSDDNKYLVAYCNKQFVIWNLEKSEIVKTVRSKQVPARLLSYDATKQTLVVANLPELRTVSLATDSEQLITKVTMVSKYLNNRITLNRNHKKVYFIFKDKILGYSLPDLKKVHEILLEVDEEYLFFPHHSSLSHDEKFIVYVVDDYRYNLRYLQWVNLQKGLSNQRFTLPPTVNKNQYFNWVGFSGKNNNLLMGYQEFDGGTHGIYNATLKHLEVLINEQVIASFDDQVTNPYVQFLTTAPLLVIFQPQRKVTVIDLKTGKKVLVAGENFYDLQKRRQQKKKDTLNYQNK